MALNLERFHEEFKHDLKTLVGEDSLFLAPGQKVLFMVCKHNYQYSYAVTRQAEAYNVPRAQLDEYLRQVLPEEYFEAVDRDRKAYWASKQKH